MIIEKINMLTSAVKQGISFKKENKEKNQDEIIIEEPLEQPSKSSNKTITALSLLAAIGAAGVAVYKHKNAKEAVKKAEEEAQKKIKEAEEKAKKAIEEAEKKLQEAKKGTDKEVNEKVNNSSKEEVKENLNKKTSKDINNKTNTSVKNKKNNKNKTETKETKNNTTNKKETITTEQKKNVEKENSEKNENDIINETPSNKVNTSFDENEAEQITLEGGNIDKNLTIINRQLRKRIKQNVNGIIAIPESTKISRFIQKTADNINEIITALKSRFQRKQNVEQKTVVQPKPETHKKTKTTEKIVIQPKSEEKINTPKSEEKIENIVEEVVNHKSNVFTKTINYIKEKYNQFKSLFKRAPKIKEEPVNQPKSETSTSEPKTAESVIQPITPETEKKEKTAWQREIEQDKIRYEELVKKAKAANKKVEEAKASVKELEKKLDGSISVYVPKKLNKREHKKLHNQWQRELTDAFKNNIEYQAKFGQKIVSEFRKKLNGVINIFVPEARTKADHDAIQKEYDELGRNLQEIDWKANSKKTVKDFEQKLNGKIYVNVPQEPTQAKHNAKQALYDTLAPQEETSNNKIKLKAQKLTELSEKQLLDEYNGLKNYVKTLPVMNPASQRFLAIQGELTNHRGYRVINGNVVKPEKTKKPVFSEIKDSIQTIWEKNSKNIVSDFEQKLNGNINVKTPELKTQAERDLIQKEYDELGRILQEIDWKENSNKIVKDFDMLNGNISVVIPKIRTQAEYDLIQKEYKELGRKLQEADWGKNSDKFVKNFKQKLNGNISIKIPQAKSQSEHDLIQKEYTELGQKLQEADWKKNSKKIVKYFEQKLNGNINVKTPELKTQAEHDLIQKEYNEFEKKLQEAEWKKNSDKIVKDFEQKLNGNINVKTPELKTQAEHDLIQKEYDKGDINVKIAEKPSKDIDNSAELENMYEIEDDLPEIVETTEQEHEITLPASFIQKRIQQTKEQVEETWKTNTKAIVKDFEQKLDGSITVDIPRKNNKNYHNKLQKEYNNMGKSIFETHLSKKEIWNQIIDRAKKISDANSEKKYNQYNGKQLSIEPISTFQDTDNGVVITRNVVKGLNDRPEGFNERERILTKNNILDNESHRDEVTKYPKLYADKEGRKAALKDLWQSIKTGSVSIQKIKDTIAILREEKLALKEMERLRQEHIERRLNNYMAHGGAGDYDIALHNKFLITNDMKYSYKKYASMSKQRPTEKDWEVEMTREEFMKNKEQYMQEAYEREHLTQIEHSGYNRKHKKQTFLNKVKKLFGF